MDHLGDDRCAPHRGSRLFRLRNFAFGNLALCLGYAVFFGNILLLPLWLQTNLGYTATWAGLVCAKRRRRRDRDAIRGEDAGAH